MKTKFHIAKDSSPFERGKVAGAYRAEDSKAKKYTEKDIFVISEGRWQDEIKTVFNGKPPSDDEHKKFIEGFIFGFNEILKLKPNKTTRNEIIFKIECVDEMSDEVVLGIMEQFSQVSRWYKSKVSDHAPAPIVTWQTVNDDDVVLSYKRYLSKAQ